MPMKQRWHETLVNTKTNKPTQKKVGKDLAALTAPASSGGKQAGSSMSKPGISCGGSNSLSSRDGDLVATGSKTGGSLKRGTTGHQSTRQASHPTRPAFRLCSSRSFSSLNTSSFTAAPFMRSSRSLSRLDRRSVGDDSDYAGTSSQVKRRQSSEKTVLDCGQLSSSEDQIRDNKDQCHEDNAEKMEIRTTSEPLESSSSACHHHYNKVKKEPDLLDFKKGWMMQQDTYGQWQKYWFVLTDQILRFYKDSVAEEAAEVDGEINLSTCFDITDYPAQKNCGFQIHTRDGVHTLCAVTTDMRCNWVQAVLKSVKPTLTPDVTNSLLEHNAHQKSQQPDSQAAEVFWKEKETQLQPEREQSSADGSSASSTVSFSHPSSLSATTTPSPISPTHQEGEGVSCHQCPLLVGTTQTAGVTSRLEGGGSDSSTSTVALSNDECLDEHSNMQSEIEQYSQQVKTTTQKEEKRVTINTSCECTEEKEKLPCEQQTGQLVKELEQTQRELSRLQQLNRNLQDELQQEKKINSRERIRPQNELLKNSNLSSEQALALQQLHKINRDLRFELEAQKRSQEEARETELQRRADLLAQQAQLLVTGDATALAQVHLEQDRRRFHEQQVEWEHCMASLKSQLNVSEEQRREAEARLMQLQQELQSYHDLQQEADQLQKRLQDMATQLRDNEEAQTQKEARLQKHLMLLQASQDRERRSLAASLAQTEERSQDLQERLDRAEQQVESLNKSQTLTREIEEAQQQLQEEMACTVSAVQRLQEEREQLDRRCQELHNQLSEADGEVGRLQSRLKTEETHYYNLEHSYESVSEELQLALGKVQQRESETQDMREGYERLLDTKEQELNEVLLKMEVLGNSLEETEVKLNEVLKVCICGSSQLKDESSDPAQHNERQQQTTEALAVNNSRPKAMDDGQFSNSSTDINVQINGNHSHADHARARSRSIDASYQYIVTAGDDPERFMSVIQLLETKLYVTEEKLRDITHRLEEHQNHNSCQDPHLCSQLTQSRATAQHLSLVLHSQAKQSQRFAQETENRCRMLVDRFQVALNIILACRERLQTRQTGTTVDMTDFERQLAAVAACLQQGEREAGKQQRESHNASKVEDKILSDKTLVGAESNVSANTLPSENDMETVAKCLTRELVVVGKMVSVLQSRSGFGQLSSVPREGEGDVAHRYKSIISQIIALKTEKKTQSGREECDSHESLESAIGRACAEAELIYAAFRFQQQYESKTQVNNQEVELLREGLADISPPELASYEEQVKGESRGLEGAAKPLDKDEFVDKKVKAEKEPDWLERLISRLQKRSKFLCQLCQEISDSNGLAYSKDDNWGNYTAVDLNWMQEQAKLIYLSDRLHLDLEQELQQSEALQGKVQALSQQQDISLMDEQEAFNHTLYQLQEDNSVLREELERAEQRIISVETGNQRLLQDIQKIEDYHEERMQKLETEFREKIRELQQIHEEEMRHLHCYYSKSCFSKEKLTERASSPPDQTIKASCDQGFPAMEETHRKLIGDLQQQHQREVAALQKEKDQLLQEETSATMAAIVAMRRAHKEELEKSRRSQHIKESADITQLHSEYEKGIQLLRKELEMLSLQHTQKCLENSQLSQELQDERKSLMQYQKENQELKKKQRETEDVSRLHFSLNRKQSHAASQAKDFYEMEVILRAREAEMHFLRQEACSLREELKIARMDKIYAQNKLKALYTTSQDDDVTWPPSRNVSAQNLDDTVTNSSNAAFLKKTDKSSLTRQIRGVRSKSLKEGLSAQERMKLFDSF
ncbi:trichohyalin [Thunnus maccoyii]|uniref:trichohyalin n=1 Tax=Thunnus maccoyii TaxID=8240 RepID=UPI001C4AC0AB|nr:trichohyalin [Thunnus maccoyii]